MLGLAGWMSSELAGTRSAISMSKLKIKVKIQPVSKLSPFSSSRVPAPTSRMYSRFFCICLFSEFRKSAGKWFRPQQLSPQRWAQLQPGSLVRTSKVCYQIKANCITFTTAYAFYFDYKRRNDPQFRKQLKKESKRQAKAAKEEAEANTVRQRQAIRSAIEEVKEEGFPTDVEEKEAYFMQEVARGEGLSGEGM